MSLNIKKPGELEKELLKYSSGASPVILLDTGGLIDISHATREFGLSANGKRIEHPHYTTTPSFLRNISRKIPVLITPKTYQEIQNHGRMRLNSHIVELNPATVDYSLEVMLGSSKFIDGLAEGISFDDARYDAYWAALTGCNINNKKKNEGCSDTDKEILSFAAYLSSCRQPIKPYNKINPVLVISPDLHLIHGSKALTRDFDGKYSHIISVSTRE